MGFFFRGAFVGYIRLLEVAHTSLRMSVPVSGRYLALIRPSGRFWDSVDAHLLLRLRRALLPPYDWRGSRRLLLAPASAAAAVHGAVKGFDRAEPRPRFRELRADSSRQDLQGVLAAGRTSASQLLWTT